MCGSDVPRQHEISSPHDILRHRAVDYYLSNSLLAVRSLRVVWLNGRGDRWTLGNRQSVNTVG